MPGMKKRILFVTHSSKQCGVYEFGKKIFQAISTSDVYNFIKVECNSLGDLKEAINTHLPQAIIYNYHPTVLPWVCTKVSKGLYKNNISAEEPIQIGLIHEVTQIVADTATGYRNKWILGESQKKLNSLFDFYIAPDPTLLLKNPLVFKTGRLIDKYEGYVQPKEFTFGSFGFGTPNKGFQNVVKRIQSEFDAATIRLNIPAADFGDEKGENAKNIAADCEAIITKPGIKLEVSHEFKDNTALLDFLAGNAMNIFLYEDKYGRGLSSAVDNALSVQRPIAVSRSPMFRHILSARPSVCAEDNSLKEILANGFGPLEKISKDWTSENLKWEYERVLNRIFRIKEVSPKTTMGIVRTLQSLIRRQLSLPDKSFTWLRNTISASEDELSEIVNSDYQPVSLPPAYSFNRILNDDARELYKPSVKKLFALAPKTMAKKIERANVQQAFVFDTVYRFLNNYQNPKLLCVGSYEDTASMSLKKMGHEVEEIDPMINYYLQEFYTKPTTIKDSYDIIFSTSVIEHDPNDESFIKCIDGLLRPGGIVIITCDYKDGWKPGDDKPEVDARFYTKYDLQQRLPSYVPNCELVGAPQWDFPNPDFTYLGKYHYSFASLVFRKKSKE
jgi:SAM-dependent methyltransferase